MTSPKRCKNRLIRSSGGSMIADVMVASALAALFIVLTTGSFLDARAAFDRARDRKSLLDAFEAGSDRYAELMPGEAREESVAGYDSTQMRAEARLYGNERIETVRTVSSGRQSIAFSRVRIYPFTDPEEVIDEPVCSVDFSASGQRSIHVRPLPLPIDPLLPLTDMEARNGRIYISADSARGSDPDLIVIDVRSPESPRVLDSLNTGPGIAALSVAGSRIFAAAASSASQLHVMRVNGEGKLSLVSRYQLPLPYATATPPFGSSIAYAAGALYLGTEKWDGAEIARIDVRDEQRPTFISGIERGSKVTDLFELRGSLYATGAGESQAAVYDMTDPEMPQVTGSFRPLGWSRQEGIRLSLFEGALGLARTSGGFDIRSDHEAFAWGPASSTTLAHPSSANIPGGAYGIITDRSMVFVASREFDKEFRVYDRSLATSSLSAYPLPVAPETLTCDNEKLYVLAHAAPAIYEITFF